MLKFYWKHIDYCLDFDTSWHFRVPVLLDETAVPTPTAQRWQGFEELETCPHVFVWKWWRHWYLRPPEGNFGVDDIRLVNKAPIFTRNEYYEETDNPMTLDEMIKKFPADKVIQYCVERGMAMAVK